MLTAGLLPWYEREKRDLPWRRNRDPYRIWISETMLQQTRVEAVRPRYEAFLAALPDVRALAEVPQERLLKLWEGLGYYARARNLQRAAQEIVARGGFPRTAAELRTLPGFGPYTAGAVASIAFGERVPAVDGNVLRVYARLDAVTQSVRRPSVRRDCEAAVLAAMPADADPGAFNQALMELGALVCVPRSPKCGACPLAAGCRGRAEGLEAELPVREPPGARAVEAFDVYLIVADGRALVRRRPGRGLLAGLWEFPHGEKIEPLAVAEREGPRVRHVFTHRIWEMRGVYARLLPGAEAALSEREGWAWVDAPSLSALPMASAMEPYRQDVLESGGLTRWTT
ncbi:MAG: A/G-specific adenine glycosylase [Candidatus Spyradocola sp.]|jgi:A/G-specific adenine glycosylase